uniref:Anoctamin n=1 Tax=Esox lucius TaxID=8010 RepID=A0A3P8ZUZ2_ESOLU
MLKHCVRLSISPMAFPLILLEFHPEAEADTVDWLLGRILTKESLGGLDLLARVISQNRAGGAIIAVGTTSERLLLEADEDLLFRPKPGCSLRAQLPEVGDPGGMSTAEGVCGILSSAECVTLLQRILARLRVGVCERVQVFRQIHLLPDEPVVASLSSNGVLTDTYPFHEAQLLQSLQGRWRHQQLLEEIRSYFGEAVALYFELQGLLVGALFLKSTMSIFLHFYALRLGWGMVLFTLSGFVWSGLFLQRWRQKSKDLERDWGTVVVDQAHSHSSTAPAASREAQGSTPPQPEGLRKMVWKRLQHSFTFLTCNLCLSSTLILMYLHLDGLVEDVLQNGGLSSICYHILVYIPEITLTVAMAGMDCLAFQMSQSLDHEQTGEKSTRKQPLLPEVILSCMFNHFAVHFYRVLVLDDVTTVRFHLAVQLATLLGLKLLSAIQFNPLRKRRVPPGDNYQELQPPIVKQITEQSSRPPCDTQTRGYLELLISYCHVMFFSGIYPKVALWCLLTIGTKSHVDLWHLCSDLRRPFPQTSHRDDTLWRRVFRGFEALAILLNSLSLWSSPDSRFLFPSTGWELLTGFLLLTLLVLGLRGAVAFLVLHLARGDGRRAEQPETRRPRLPRLHRHQHQQ